MELCSGDSPKRSRTMCKTTDEPVGIPVPLPAIQPPIESWYVVARKIRTGTCSIYSSWKNYQEETELLTTPSTVSPGRAEKKKRAIEDVRSTELAAFPTVAQAIAYVKNIRPESPRRMSPVTASITSSPATHSTPGNTSAGGRIIQSNLSPDDSQSSVPRGDANHDNSLPSRSSPASPSRKRMYKSAMKTIEVIDQTNDRPNDNSDEDRDEAAASKSSPSPVPSDCPLKKRKVDARSIRSTVPKFTNRPLTMSKTSETIDIGAPTRSTQELSSLDALAIAASASTNKKAGKMPKAALNQPVARTPGSLVEVTNAATASDARNPLNEGARLLPAELIGARGALHAAMGRSLPDRHSPSLVIPNIAARNIANRNQHQKLLLQLKKEDEELKRQIQEEEQKIRHYKARKDSLPIPKVPTPLSSLRIPEVPKGFVPMEKRSPDRITRAISDLKSSIDRKIMRNASVPSMALSASNSARAISNRLSSLDSFPLGSLSSQIQQQHHLQTLQHQASLYRKSANLLSLQLQASRNPLMHQLRGGGLQAQQLALQQQIQHSQQMIDLASSSSECDHSEITLKRRNGRSSETSSPMTLGSSSTSKR